MQINVSLTKGGDNGDKFKEYIRKEGIGFIQKRIADYVQALKDG